MTILRRLCAIAGVQQEIAAVRSAPLRKSSQQETVRSYLARLAQGVGPKVSFDAKGNARILWNEDMIASKDDLMGILAWVLGPQQLLAAFSRDQQEPERGDAVSPLEREKRLAELAAALLSLERREEALIECAANDGVELPRRPDASPLAVLGVVIVAKEARQVA
jgi:hypothetical protein